MKGIDENGRLFGVVNVIDAMGVVLVLALVVAAGVAFAGAGPIGAGDGGDEEGNEAGNATETPTINRTTVAVQFQLLDDARYIVEGIERGPVPGTENISAVLGTSRTTPVETGDNNTTSTASARLRLNVTEQDGNVQFNGERLYIGREVRLDLGNVIVDAIVTDITTNRAANTAERTRT